MMELKVTLTNEEVGAIIGVLDEGEETLAGRLSGDVSARDNSTVAYNAWRKITGPLRSHLKWLKEFSR